VNARSLAEDIVDVLEDFPSFCSLLEIKTKAGGMVRFDYKRWNDEQKRFERERTGRDIGIKPRQIGFSTLELARDLQFAVVRPGVNVQVVVHDAEIKNQLFLNLRVMAECLKRRGLLPRTRYSTKTELVFADTGSAVRIVESGSTEKAAQSKGRSGTIHRLHATEMAFWGAAAETWNALSAATPDSAEIIIESTANGAGGLFYDAARGDTRRTSSRGTSTEPTAESSSLALTRYRATGGRRSFGSSALTTLRSYGGARSTARSTSGLTRRCKSSR
jgi:hypothetical protein